MHCSWLQYICWLSPVHGRGTINLRQTSKLDVNTARNSTATVGFLLTGPPIALDLLSFQSLCLTIVCGEKL